MSIIVVVGEKFRAFAENSGVICIGDLERLLGEDESFLDHHQFELGQGVAAEQVARVLAKAERTGRRHSLLFDRMQRCDTKYVHKVDPRNSMISCPIVQRDEQTFEAHLLLDDGSEFLSDHVGGRHLPGMILVEAARQMGLAVIEEHYASDFPNGCAFLWTSIRTDFAQYAFPVKTLLQCQMQDVQVVRVRRMSMTFDVACIQNSLTVATSHITCELHDRRVVERQEKSLAAAASRGSLRLDIAAAAQQE